MIPWPAIVLMTADAALIVTLRFVTWAILVGRRILERSNPRPGVIDWTHRSRT